ncbi:MAG TPA: hypothetical protein VFL57_16620, partial [Bryobacteraceae bacterium]|nr:hypothetical protein [Bryobacteraceae bacterium]
PLSPILKSHGSPVCAASAAPNDVSWAGASNCCGGDGVDLRADCVRRGGDYEWGCLSHGHARSCQIVLCQSQMQEFVNAVHRPAGVQLWRMVADTPQPVRPAGRSRSEPLLPRHVASVSLRNSYGTFTGE